VWLLPSGNTVSAVCSFPPRGIVHVLAFDVSTDQPIKMLEGTLRGVTIIAISARDDPAHNRLMIPIAETTQSANHSPYITGMTIDPGPDKGGP
jgi:UDP-N-acetyl-D-mannosaminuronate dehydrogenase